MVNTDFLANLCIVGQRVIGILVWIVVKGCRFAVVHTVVISEAEFWSEEDVPGGVWFPFYPVLEAEALVIPAAPVVAVSIGRIFNFEILAVGTAFIALLSEVTTHASVQLHHLVLPVHGSAKTLVVGHAIAVGIVAVPYHAELLVSYEAVKVQSSVITVFGSVGSVQVTEETAFPVFLIIGWKHE